MTALLPEQRTRLLSLLEEDRSLQQAIELMGVLALPWTERAVLCRQLIDADRWWAAMYCATPDDRDQAVRRFRALALRSAQRWGVERLPALAEPLRVLQYAVVRSVSEEVLREAREQALGQRAGREGPELAAVMAVSRGCDPDVRRASLTLTEHRFSERRKQRQWACALLELAWLPVPAPRIDDLRPRLLEGDPEAVELISADRATVAGHFVAEGEWILAVRCFPDSDTLLYALADTCACEALPYAPRTVPRSTWKETLLTALVKGDREEIRSAARHAYWLENQLTNKEPFPSHEQRALGVIKALCKRTPLHTAQAATVAMGNMIDGEESLRKIVLRMLSLR